MPKSKSVFKALKSSFGPLLAPGSSSTASHPGIAAPTTSIRTPTPVHDLVLNNLATACRITKDVAEGLSHVPYIKPVTGVVAQIIKIHEEVQGNKERCNEIISMVAEYAYTIIECLGQLYDAEGESRLEGLKAELKSFQSYLESILRNELEPIKDQSRWKAYVKRDKDAEDMKRIEQKLIYFAGQFTMQATTVGASVAGATQKKMTEIHQINLRERLLLSQHAQYNVDVTEETPGSIDQAYCSPDTRKPILERVTDWACDRDPTSPAVFWMVGEGGAGKSTIARTIAMKFDEDNTLPPVATFFCSRKFSDTSQQGYIIPTLAYQLAGLCPFYASELLKDPNIADSLRVSAKQMDSLLAQPWKASSGSRSPDMAPFLVIIDALDEIVSQGQCDGITGGFSFLKRLLMAVEQGDLTGIKFFVTSRPHPELFKVCQSLPSEAICRLFEIPTNEVEQDINRYLQHRLPDLQTPVDSELLRRIAAKADGLFIFASTAVLMANPTSRTTKKQQRKALQGVLNGLTRHHVIASPVDNLYCQVLRDAFQLTDDDDLSDRLDLLHSIICTEDRVSVDVLVNLVLKEDDDPEDVQEMVEDLLSRLHAVLSISEGRITWYHASFLDFLLSPASTTINIPGRILDASCNVHSQNARLARRCFRIMRSQLKFNICQLPSSFLLDSEVEDIEKRINDRISHVLRYACRYWAIHTSKSVGEGVQEDIEEFLDQKVLFWIETMNLLHQSGLCASLLNVVRQYISRNSPCSSELYKDLSAASHFSTVFKGSPASKSSPHLYLSTLVYTASRFPLLQKWRTRFACLPTLRTAGIGTQLLMSLDVPGGYINSVACSPNGTRIVSGDDRCPRIWDAETGEEIMILKGHTNKVLSVAFSSDSTRIVSGSDDCSVRVWDVESGAAIKVIETKSLPLQSVAFSFDGTRIVTGSLDHSVRVWDVESGKELKAFNGHTDWVKSAAFSPDGTRIVSGSHDYSVRIWDVESGEEIKTLKGRTFWVKSVAFSPDGTCVVSGSDDNTVRVWDFESGKVKLLKGHTSSVKSVAFSSDGTRIASGSHDLSVRVWDVKSGEEIKVITGHIQPLQSVAFSSDGTRIVTGSLDASVRVWDVESGEKVRALNSHTDNVRSVAFSPDGTRIASGSNDGSWRLWDVATGKEIKNIRSRTDWVNSVAFCFNGSRIVTGSLDRSVRVWDVGSGRQIKVFKGHTDWVKSVAFSPDGMRIVSGSYDNTVRVWDVETGGQFKLLIGHTYQVNSVAFSSDGTRIASGSDDCSVRVWDVEKGEEIKVIHGHPEQIQSVAFSSDGARIATGTLDNHVRVWDVELGETIKVFKGHKDRVHSVAFSFDDARIASCSNDRTVRVWNVESGKEIVSLEGHTRPVNSVAFSGSTRIVSGSYDESVRVWDIGSANDPLKSNYSTHNVNAASSTNESTTGSDSVVPSSQLHQLDWTVTSDDWIVQRPSMNRIMWLPDTFTRYLYRPANTLVISQRTANLNLVGAHFGSDWRLCYEQA